MKKTIEELVNQLIEKNLIDINNIPNIDLYVDQLTSFIIENSFSNNENNLTKSMINNYSKNKVIPLSDKKKYNKNHILLLIIIYNTKAILSISDIKILFDTFSEINVLNYYNVVTKLITLSNKTFSQSVLKDLDDINFENIDITDKEKIAILVTKLAIEANNKKMLSEQLIKNFLVE